MDNLIETIKNEVHLPPFFEVYNATNYRNNTNCYSHALGATFPKLELYRIGAISGKKPIDQKYFSVEEIKELLFLDCETLGLKIEESSLEEKLLENQYKIKLFVKIWADETIGDYHFWRLDNQIWTEKWKGYNMNQIQDTEKDRMNYFPWNFVGIYKISR